MVIYLVLITLQKKLWPKEVNLAHHLLINDRVGAQAYAWFSDPYFQALHSANPPGVHTLLSQNTQ